MSSNEAIESVADSIAMLTVNGTWAGEVRHFLPQATDVSVKLQTQMSYTRFHWLNAHH